MSEELDILKRIGTQSIHEDTHVPIVYIKAILDEDFDSFQKVQFLGFISILEKEYNLNLSPIRVKGLECFEDIDLEKGIFVIPKKKKKKTSRYFFIAIIIVLFAVIYEMNYVEKDEQTKPVVDNVLIQKVQKKIKPIKKVQELNKTSESNNSKIVLEILQPIEVVEKVEVLEMVEVLEPVEMIIKSFKIFAKSKVWLGYIDVKTNQKKQKIFRGEIEFNPNKKWLLVFGHAHIDMYINGKIVKMSSHNNVRYLYENATLRAISIREFKKINRGHKW